MKKMKHFVFIAVLPLIILLTSATVSVRTADDLIQLFATTKDSVKDDIELLSDLDFSKANLTLPLGSQPNNTCIPFSGALHGHGHAIKNLVMNNRYGNLFNGSAGLFCQVKDALVENLRIDGSCSFQGSPVGTLGVAALGTFTARNVKHSTSLWGLQRWWIHWNSEKLEKQ